LAFYVRTPGTCGEFIQGSIKGQRFLVTCPINRYSYAIGDVQYPLPLSSISLQSKAYQAYITVLDTLGIDRSTAKPVYLHSDILQGKGLASSSADISVVAMAIAKSHGYDLSMEQLASICLSIEPTDAPFYPGIVQFDYLNGTCCELLGTCPPIRIVMFDEGGTIDTVQFNHQQNLDVLIDEKEELMVEALAKFKEGIHKHNVKLIGECKSVLDSTNGRFGKQENIYQQLWCLPKVEEQYVQVCTFTVGGHYAGSCLRSDPTRVIVGNSDMQPLRILSDKAFTQKIK